MKTAYDAAHDVLGGRSGQLVQAVMIITGREAAALVVCRMLLWLVCLSAAGLAGCLACVEEALSADQPNSEDAAARVVVTDRWNMPVALNMIPGGRPTLLLVCDPSEVRCREGAVYFDSQRRRIEAKGIKPVCVLVARRDAALEAATRMGLSVPVYVDVGGTLPLRLMGQEIMPALVLLDGRGKLVKVIVGGGEALYNNINTMLEARRGGHRVLYAVVVSLALLGVVLFASQ